MDRAGCPILNYSVCVTLKFAPSLCIRIDVLLAFMCLSLILVVSNAAYLDLLVTIDDNLVSVSEVVRLINIIR